MALYTAAQAAASVRAYTVGLIIILSFSYIFNLLHYYPFVIMIIAVIVSLHSETVTS